MALKLKAAFQRFTDEIGNLLASINRDGTISSQGLNFPDGTTQTSAASTSTTATGLANAGNTVTLTSGGGIEVLSTVGNQIIAQNGVGGGLVLTDYVGQYIKIDSSGFQVLLSDLGSEILITPNSLCRICNGAFDGFQSLTVGHVASIIVGGEDILQATATKITALQPLSLPSYTVALLPVGQANGTIAYASNGRKVGQGAGAGTGVVVYFSAAAWRVFSTDAAVAA